MQSNKRGSGSNAAGQSGDIQGLDSPRVEELVEEGQSFEAAVISGIEDAPDADEAEVTTRQVPEDDVPGEYLERDQG
jgi:N utilization substance protein A